MFKKGSLAGVIWLAVIVPVLACAQSAARQDAQSLLSAFMGYTDLRIRSVQQSLEILATTIEVRPGPWENIRGLLELSENLDGKLAV